MAGKTEIGELLATMMPRLMPGIFVFASIAPGEPLPDSGGVLMRFEEAEGTH